MRSPPEQLEWSIRGNIVRVAHWRGTGGHQRPLLFFSGIGADVDFLLPFLGRISDRDIVTFDMPGVGASSAARSPYRPKHIAKAADEILSHLGYDQVDVMGVSWGGLIAQQFAFQFRNRVDRLILAATSAGAAMIPGKLSALAGMVHPRRYNDPAFMQANFSTIYGGNYEDFELHRSGSLTPTERGYAYQILAVLGWSSVAKLPSITAQTLVLMGRDDRLVRPSNGRLLKFLLKDARLEIIEGAGHMFLLTHLDRTASLISHFLNDRAPAAVAPAARPVPALELA